MGATSDYLELRTGCHHIVISVDLSKFHESGISFRSSAVFVMCIVPSSRGAISQDSCITFLVVVLQDVGAHNLEDSTGTAEGLGFGGNVRLRSPITWCTLKLFARRADTGARSYMLDM